MIQLLITKIRINIFTTKIFAQKIIHFSPNTQGQVQAVVIDGT